MTIAGRLRRLRWSQAWTLEQAADRYGVAVSTLSRYECGHLRPAPRVVAAVARDLHAASLYHPQARRLAADVEAASFNGNVVSLDLVRQMRALRRGGSVPVVGMAHADGRLEFWPVPDDDGPRDPAPAQRAA